MTDQDIIRNMIADYCSLADQGKYELWIKLFSEDAVFKINGELVATGADQIYAKFTSRISPPGTHVAVNVRIEVQNATSEAKGDFFFLDSLKKVAVIGRYEALLKKYEGVWKIIDWHINHW
jgi:hypothetical protein